MPQIGESSDILATSLFVIQFPFTVTFDDFPGLYQILNNEFGEFVAPSFFLREPKAKITGNHSRHFGRTYAHVGTLANEFSGYALDAVYK